MPFDVMLYERSHVKYLKRACQGWNVIDSMIIGWNRVVAIVRTNNDSIEFA